MSKLYNPEYLKEKKLEPKFYKEGQHHLSFIEPLTDKTFCYKAKNWNGKLWLKIKDKSFVIAKY